MTRRIVAAALTLVAAAAMVRPALAADEETTLALPATAFNFIPNYVALDMGFWKREGLDVSIKQIAGIGAMNAVLSGSVDFTNSSVATLVRVNIRGQHVIALGTALNGIMQEIVLSKKAAAAAGVDENSPMAKKGQALRGKKIAIDAPNTLPHALARYVARAGGVDPEREVTFTSMQPQAAIAALKQGTIDGMAGGLPWNLIPQQGGYGILLASGVRDDFPELRPIANNMILTRAGTCEKKPTVCRKLMAGFTKAAAFILDHPAEAAASLRKRFAHVDPKLFDAGFAQIRRWMPRSTKVDEAVFTNTVKFMVAGGMLKPGEKPPVFASIYTNEYAR